MRHVATGDDARPAHDGLQELRDALVAAAAEQKRTNDLALRYEQSADPQLLLAQFAQILRREGLGD